MTSYSEIPNTTLYLDIETTGGRGSTPGKDTLIELAIVNDDGKTIVNTLINPERDVCETKRYIGITDEMLVYKRTLRELWPMIEAIVTGCHIVMYNADRDRQYFPKWLTAAGHISCAMKRFAPIYGSYSPYHGDYTFQRLTTATDYIEHDWGKDQPHRALPDALACRAVWQWMEERDDFNGIASFTRSSPKVVALNNGST